MYYIKKFGLENHMNRLKIKKHNYVKHLLGQVNFIVYINPSDNEFVEYKQYLQTLINPLKGDLS
jgi:RNA-directed DNA polymerase